VIGSGAIQVPDLSFQPRTQSPTVRATQTWRRSKSTYALPHPPQTARRLFRQRGIAERRQIFKIFRSQIFAIQDMEEGDAKTAAITEYKNALAKEEY
jgi:hypothetical protein